jgi:hypothetical protein
VPERSGLVAAAWAAAGFPGDDVAVLRFYGGRGQPAEVVTAEYAPIDGRIDIQGGDGGQMRHDVLCILLPGSICSARPTIPLP